MPQLQNLVLPDRGEVPAEHTFVPRDIRDNVATVVESNGVPVGESRVSLSLRRTVNNRYKSTVKLAIPVVQDQTVNGIVSPVVVRTAYATVEFDFDATSSFRERNNVQGMVQAALGVDKPLVYDTVVGLQGIY